MVEAIKEAVRKAEGVVDFLHRGETTIKGGAAAVGRQLPNEAAACYPGGGGKDPKGPEGAYFFAMAKAKAQVASLLGSTDMHAGVMEAIDDLMRNFFTTMKNILTG